MAEQNYPCFTIRKNAQGEWYWTYYAGNAQVIAMSSDGYTEKSACRHAVELIQKSGDDPVYEA